MIAEKRSDIAVLAQATGRDIRMMLDEDGLEKIMGMLVDMYEDPETAVVREYSTNAYDAHIDAGTARPIEVTLPNPLNPVLSIKDYGTGMTEDDIENVYSKYGKSTKTDTNDQVGMLGLGGKSALTYTSQFSVISTKDGEKITVNVTRAEEGGGTMTVVSKVPTDEPNGTEVIVPTQDYNSFTEKARFFFQFWPEGTVLVNGEQPERLTGIELDPDVIVTKELDSDYVVMGNVPYPVRLNAGITYPYNAVVFVPIGAVTPNNDREGLRMTPATTDALDTIRDFIKSEKHTLIQRLIDEAETPAEAMRLRNKLVEIFKVKGRLFTYDGNVIPRTFKGVRIVMSDRNSHKLSSHSTHNWIDAAWLTDALIVTGYQLNFTPGHKKKLNKWVGERGFNVRHYLLVNTKLDTEWIDPESVIDWDTIREVKLPRPVNTRTRATNRIPGSYDVWDDGTYRYGVAANSFDLSQPLYYVTGAMFGNAGATDAARLVAKRDRAAGKKSMIVWLPPNRIAKFQRTLPQALPLKDRVTELYRQDAKKVTKRQLEAYWLRDDWSLTQNLKLVDTSKIDDPAIKQAAKLVKDKLADKVIATLGPYSNLVRWLNVKNKLAKPKDFQGIEDPFDNYPLFDTYRLREYPEDMYLYLNAAYAARKDSK